MSFRDIALDHLARGFHVFPCVPVTKKPLLKHGHLEASNDEAKVREWWAKWPDANVGLACGVSRRAVLDNDTGLTSYEDFVAWRERAGLPRTYTVRTGRRTNYGVQMYFRGGMKEIATWNLAGCSGQVKSLGGYVMAAGCIHPDSKEAYEVIDDTEEADIPEVVTALAIRPERATIASSKVPKTAWSLPVHESENRTGFLLEQTGALRNLGCGKDAILARMVELNDDPDIIADPVDGERLESTAENCAKYPVPEPEPAIKELGRPGDAAPSGDWRAHYHTRAETENAPKPEFLIDGFLQRQAIVGIAGYVGHKKSLVALNISYSLCSGEPLFGCFRVLRRPTRVLYLCPEMALIGFANRIARIGLLPYVGETFFYSTMSMKDGVIKIPAITIEEAEGAVIILDTAIRFIEGDENSSQHMKELATQAFGLIRSGAEDVIVLAHSNKEMVKSTDLTLDNAMRGSSELTAFLSSCWATRVQDPENPYESASLLKHVKPRDFEAEPFEVITDRETCRMTFVQGSLGAVVARKSTADADGKEEAALQVIRDNPALKIRALVLKLKDMGITRRKSWVGEKCRELRGTGIAVSISG